MPKDVFSGTFRGGSTVAPDATASGIASTTDKGTQGNYDTVVFQFSGVSIEHKGGSNHEAQKGLSMVHVQQERMRRAHQLASKADQKSGILRKRLGQEVNKTFEHRLEKTGEAIQDAITNAQNWFFGVFEEKKDEEEESEQYGVSKLKGHAAVSEIVARNAKEASYRAELEMEKARQCRQSAITAARGAKNLPAHERMRLVDPGAEEKLQKLPSTLKITVSSGTNFPTRKNIKNVNPYAVISLWTPNEENPDEIPDEIQTAVTPIVWKSSNPDFLFTFDFYVLDDWDDEFRPEVVEIKFYDCASTNLQILKPVVGDDPLVGMLRFPLREVCKRVQALRWPDGREEKAHFKCELSKWCDLLDEDENPVKLEVEQNPKEEPVEPLPCQALIGIQYLDSAKKPKVVNTMQAVQMPKRKPFPDPVPRPPPTWVDHPCRDGAIDA